MFLELGEAHVVINPLRPARAMLAHGGDAHGDIAHGAAHALSYVFAPCDRVSPPTRHDSQTARRTTVSAVRRPLVGPSVQC